VKETDLYVGKDPATFEFEGAPVFIGPNIVVRAGHPIMKGREHLFTPLVVHYDLPGQAAQDDSKTDAKGDTKTVKTPTRK